MKPNLILGRIIEVCKPCELRPSTRAGECSLDDDGDVPPPRRYPSSTYGPYYPVLVSGILGDLGSQLPYQEFSPYYLAPIGSWNFPFP